jgi:cellulose synthase (UDP-forming)
LARIVTSPLDMRPITHPSASGTNDPPANLPSRAVRFEPVPSFSVLTASQRRLIVLLISAWIVANLVFWVWWLRPDHVANKAMFTIFTVAFAYEMVVLPSLYMYYVSCMRRPFPVSAPQGLQVAMITPCVPAKESMDVIREQLVALNQVVYPHDSWILDEGNDPLVRDLAHANGVRYFTRSGVDRYNASEPPFQAKTKAGNVNAWLDAHGAAYEIFVQLDIDHRPSTVYLDKVLGYFTLPGVAWVQAPSVYGNLENWTARGAAEQELVLQGPLQQGFFGATETPFIIGSHSTYRTAAILGIGGFQPTRAEDHLDTVMLASRGFRGVYVPEIIAWGSGPGSFDTYLRQQFAWAYSLLEVLIRFTPRMLLQYRPKLALQFLFAQSWYALWSTSLLALYVLPIAVLLTGARPSDASLLGFLFAWLPMSAVAFGFWLWSRQWQLPPGLGLSWRGIVLHIARWPVVFWAFVNVILGVQHPYMITPKGQRDGLPSFRFITQAAYLVATWASIGAVWWHLAGRGMQNDGTLTTRPELDGYVIHALWGASFMLGVFVINGIMDFFDLRRRGLRGWDFVRRRTRAVSIFVATVAAFGITGWAARDLSLTAIFWLNETEAAARPSVIEKSVMDVTESSATPAKVELLTAPDEASDVVANETAASATIVTLPGDYVALGAYDPNGVLESVSYEMNHVYVRQDAPQQLAAALEKNRGTRILMATIEPWPAGLPSDRDTDIGAGFPVESVTAGIAAGERDDELEILAIAVKEVAPQVVFVRWAHEMDLAGLYPWAGGNEGEYKAAFRHVVRVFDDLGATNAAWVWSPAGQPDAGRYYPGDDSVDFVGITVLADPIWDAEAGRRPQSFRTLMTEKYETANRFRHPIIVAELGVSGSDDRQATWLRDAAVQMPLFPAVTAVVYFNDVNTPNPSTDYLPDWRISAMTFAGFLRDVRNSTESTAEPR